MHIDVRFCAVMLPSPGKGLRQVTRRVLYVQCVRFIYAYMGFAGFSIFFILTGIISLQLIEKSRLQLDAFSFLYFLYNFAVSFTSCSPLGLPPAEMLC